MRRKWCRVVMIAALAVCLAGCGAREQQKDSAEKNQVDAVVRNAGMTSEEQQRLRLKADIEPEVILTEHCLYTVSDDEEDLDSAVIVQKDHQGNELKRIPLKGVSESDLLDLLCGSDKHIIFSKYAEDGFLNLYSVPVLQTDDGETVPWEKAERIGSCYEEEIVGYAQAALCEPYLIYREDAHTLVRLDMETGDRKTYAIPLTIIELYNFANIDGYLYLVSARDEDSDSDSAINFCIHRINFNDGTSEKLYESERQEYPHSLYIDGKFLYMWFTDMSNNGSVPARMECFDLEQKKIAGQLFAREIEDFMREKVMAGSVEECWEHYEGDCFFVYAGRLYMMENTSWLTEKGGDGEVAIPRTVLLSCSANDLTDLKSEQDLAVWFQKQKCDKSAVGLGGYGDVYYFIYDSYEDQQPPKTHLMRYYLDTKQIEEVDHKELIWQGYSASYSWE